jgi:DNA repair exonuclease SbcCD nuclease subunit
MSKRQAEVCSPEYKSRASGFRNLTLAGLRIDPTRIIAIPGNHDKLLRKDLEEYDADFADPLKLPIVEKQRSTIVISSIANRDVIFILVEANRYASEDGVLDPTCREHLASGLITDELEADVMDELDLLRQTGTAGEFSLATKFEETIKIMVVHFAVDLRQVHELPRVQESILPHECDGLDRLVQNVRSRFGLDLVVHGHLHKPALYQHARVPVLAVTTATQEDGENGFHIVKFSDTGEI